MPVLKSLTVMAASLALGAAALISLPSVASAASTDVVISEVYGGGGNSGGAFDQDFIELANRADRAIDLAGWRVEYASTTGVTWLETRLTGTMPAGGRFLIAEGKGSNLDLPDLPTPDVTGEILISGSGGKVRVRNSSDALVDLVGWGNATTFEGGGPAPATTSPVSVQRNAGLEDTDENATDFSTGIPTPTAGGSEPGGPTTAPIAEIQGPGAASPLVGRTVITTGVVTAAYPTGGLNGFVIQTAGSGGPPGPSHNASDAIFVYSTATVGSVAIDDHVEVTGTVSEFRGLTEITVLAGGVTHLEATAEPVTAVSTAWPEGDARRESLESMLVDLTGDFTVTDNFSTNRYGEVGLASGTTPLLQPTEVGRPLSAEAIAAEADNTARALVLDDGASTDFLNAANQAQTPPYVSLTNPVRVGAAVSLGHRPLILDYRNNGWTLNPTAQFVAGSGNPPATFDNDRTAAPREVGGDLQVASFNVLNYFTTLGAGTPGCVPFIDRTGDPVTVASGCTPRGAWDPADLQRQQNKIVAAIDALGADVVGLLEIENSLVVDGVADEALGTLVDALNAKAGAGTWAFVPSSAELPPATQMDVITNAIIYRTAVVQRLGESHALGTASGTDGVFANAREPIGQAFSPIGGGDPVLVVVNHFKSKSSAGPLPGDEDQGDGQGESNASRVAQATALRDWLPTIQNGVQSVALVGDFNSYTHEDPLQVLYDAGFSNAASQFAAGEYSYSFDGRSGSLDHVLLNAAAWERATGADVWEINAEESVALEYSRYDYHGTLFYAPDPFRSSDHDPVIVGLSATIPPLPSVTTLTASPWSQVYGDSDRVLLTATVTSDGAVSGPVAFVSGGTVLGTAELNGNGTARLRLPAKTPAGTYRVVARWAGTPEVAGSSSSAVTVTVDRATSRTRLIATPGFWFFPTTVLATVRLDSGRTAAGVVTIRDGGRLVATIRLRQGVAFDTLPDLSRGRHTLTATFVPTSPANVAGSTSAPTTIRVR